MSQIEWQIVKDVFYTALSRPVGERPDYLDSACGDNRPLRSEVEVLLESYESGFLESPLLAGKDQKVKLDEPLLEQGRIFSHYQILRLLGRGGMGEVYLANDTALDRLTAIKVIHGDSGFGDQSANRLVREARAVAKLDHINICPVYEVGETDGQPFIAMQYVEGEMLETLIERAAIPFEDALSYARQIAAALSKAHSWGIIHRDIKPSNVIVDSHGQLKVLDFGLAKETMLSKSDDDLSEAGLIAGTVTYMSPEHVRGQEINGQTDIWSLGVVFYQMLTGKLPFRGETKADLIAAILTGDFVAAGDLVEALPVTINQTLNRTLQKDRSLRYATVEEFDADLAQPVVRGTISTASRFASFSAIQIGASGVARGFNRIHLLRYALPALLLLAIAGGGLGLWRHRAANVVAQPFAANALASLQISTIYDLKRQVGGVILDLSFSPDGTMIAFVLNGRKGQEVYVQPLSGLEPVLLTNEKNAGSPIWSSDGQRIAFVSSRDGKNEIWAVSYSGGDPAHLADLENVGSSFELRKWSNDGRKIFIERGDGPKEIDLATGIISAIDLTGIEGTIRRGFAVSPDESRMFTVSNLDGKEQLWVKSLQNNDARRLPDASKLNGVPTWFPDNNGYAYSSDRTGNYQIYVGTLDGSQPRQITSGGSNSTDPVVSPDGNRIAYISPTNEANLFSTDIESHKETVVTSKTNMQVLPAFSPDGRHIAYQTIGDATQLFSGTLKIDSIDQNRTTPVISPGQSGAFVKWSPNGEEVNFVRRSGRVSNIWKFGLRDQKETQITTGGIVLTSTTVAPLDLHVFPFELSSDGSQIAFVSDRSGRDNIWTVASEGGDEKMLTDIQGEPSQLGSPLWSPNGDQFAFIEAIRAGPDNMSKANRIKIYKNGIVTIAAEFKSLATLLAWSKSGDGVYVGVAQDRYYDICFVSAEHSGFRRKVRLPSSRRFGVQISPDRRSVVYSERVGDIDNLYMSTIEGGVPKRVTANTDTTFFYSGVTWSPDSKTLLYSKQTGGLQIAMISNIQ